MDRSIAELLDAVDLRGLADRLLVPAQNPRMRSWSCPVHEGQTGRTPPVTIFRDRRGLERWHCHACGAGGTAIDLVMAVERCDRGAALRSLDEHNDLRGRGQLRVVEPPASGAPAPGCLAAYVLSCEESLASGPGGAVARWLAGRGLEEGVLRANRVGADPGPRALPRARGLPAGGIGAVLPVLDREGEPVGVQVRYLRPRRLRYQSPSAAVVPHPPHLAVIRPPAPPPERQVVVVCEGMIDAMTVAQAGWRACAVLGVGLAGDRLGRELMRRYPGRDLVVGFDADAAGESGAARLVDSVRREGAQARRLVVPAQHGDLNGWACADRDFVDRLGEAVLHPPAARSRMSGRAPPGPLR